ncbi:MAG: class I SAM-dependent methyltransferase [Burkholderiaceae bacterium]
MNLPPSGEPAGEDMVAYYQARAREYERIYDKPERQQDLARLRTDLAQRLAGRRILELACGTGYWTAVLASRAISIRALDMAPQTLAIAAAKPALQGRATLTQGDAYAPAKGLDGQRFDALFAGFWLSHVPRERLAAFLDAMSPASSRVRWWCSWTTAWCPAAARRSARPMLPATPTRRAGSTMAAPTGCSRTFRPRISCSACSAIGRAHFAGMELPTTGGASTCSTPRQGDPDPCRKIRRSG